MLKCGLFIAIIFASLSSAAMAQVASFDPVRTGSTLVEDKKRPLSAILEQEFAVGRIQGVVVASQQAKLSARQAGSIVSIGPNNGEAFKKGDVLVAFDCRISKAELSQIEAETVSAKAVFDVQTKRVGNGSAGKLKLIDAETKLAGLKAKAIIQQQLVDECEVLAPFDGVVVERVANPFETVNIRDALMEIMGIADMELRAFVPSHLLNTLEPGSEFSFEATETGAVYSGEVLALGARIDNVSRLVEIRGRLETKGRIFAGMSGAVRFEAKGLASE